MDARSLPVLAALTLWLSAPMPPALAEPASPSAPAPAPTAAAFAGKWSGKWDGIWAVQFTVSPSTNASSIDVVYEWEEDVGQPMRRQRFVGSLKGGALKVGTRILIELDPKDPGRAKATGRFAEPRKADLKRETK